MLRAKQEVPILPTLPAETIRYLRAKLILEEAIETINALGFAITSDPKIDGSYCGDGNLTEIVDGCCDLMVVTTGTLSACGLADERLQEIVDLDNLKKFKPGYTLSPEGKLIKPPGHKGPTELIEYEIENQRCRWKD